MKAVDAMKEVFKDLKAKDQIIQTLKTLHDKIPTDAKSSQVKKLEALKADGLIDDSVYKAAMAKIKAQRNGFDEDTLKKLRYYRNVLNTLINALKG